MTIKFSMATHDSLLEFVKAIQLKQSNFSDFYNKLEAIDAAYAKGRIRIADNDVCTGANSTVSPNEAIKVPIVNSEIDSIVGFLSDIFVNRSPLFPVISDKSKPELALKMQALIANDARQQRWGRQLLLFLTKAARYNIAAIEVETTQQKDFNLFTADETGAVGTEPEFISTTRFNAMDMYNTLFDYRVSPADIPIDGEYVGYNKIISKTALKTLGTIRAEEGIAYNLNKAFVSTMADLGAYWRVPPDIATAVHLKGEDQIDWFNWAGITEKDDLKMPKSSYFYTKIYARIIPSEFNLYASSKPAMPRIVRLEIINNEYIISYKEMVTPMDMLPILFADVREDGLLYQTKSPGENVVTYQDTATELLHVRLEGSKRALSDRAIYDADYLAPLDVNAPTAAAKIPLKKALANAGDRPLMSNIYYQIPFEGQGVVNALTDLNTIMQLKDQVNGVSMGMRGEHRPGNRTAQEFAGVEGASRSKGMPYAIRIEEQVMTPAKLLVKYYLLSSDKIEKEILDTESGTVLNVNIAELRTAMLGFRITDGLRPKAALQDPSAFSTAIQFIQNTPELNQEYTVGDIFADMLAIWDIDIKKHRRILSGSNPADTGREVQPGPTNPGGEGTNT